MLHALLPLHSPLENTPHKARVERIGGGFIAARQASVAMSAQRRRAATLDGGEHFQVPTLQPGSIAVDEVLAMRANNIRHLEGWPCHRCWATWVGLSGLRGRFTCSSGASTALSRGVPAAFRWRSDKCR